MSPKRLPNIALMRVRFDGEDAAAIVLVTSADDGTVTTIPLAVLLTASMLDRITSDGRAPAELG